MEKLFEIVSLCEKEGYNTLLKDDPRHVIYSLALGAVKDFKDLSVEKKALEVKEKPKAKRETAKKKGTK